MSILNELINTLQLWDAHAIDSICNTAEHTSLCTGISCTKCPMDLATSTKEDAWNILREHYERVNKNTIIT